jgi:hypothetical protein
MKRVIALAVISIIFILIWLTTREKYTQSQLSTLITAVRPPYNTADFNEQLFLHYVANIAFSEANDDRVNELSNINSLVDVINTGRPNPLPHYATVDEINTMYDTAYVSGESGLSTRDRMILRAFVMVSTILPPFPITYTSDGVPDWTSTIIAESGKTTIEMVLYCFGILVKLHQTGIANAQQAYTPEFFDYLNSTIPDRFSPKYDRTDPLSLINAMQSDTPDEKTTWFWKAVSIGPAYISWIAENKWKLDVNWRPPA